jgi:hypothetical protein
MAKIITLTTDFGTRDPFVGEIKGVILTICPQARIVDLTHEAAAFDITAGAMALASGCSFFPKGTIHLAVVDPGVGTKRKAVAVRAGDYTFVGPDNGILWPATRCRYPLRIVELANPRYRLKKVSHTFHGRDLFAPAAAHLANGVALSRLGPMRERLVRPPFPPIVIGKEGIQGRIVAFDRFGNGITNLPVGKTIRQRARRTRVRGQEFGFGETYAEAKPGEAIALAGSHGYLEIAVNGGSARSALELRLGTAVLLKEKSQ